MSDIYEQSESKLNSGGLADVDVELLRSTPWRYNETQWSFTENPENLDGPTNNIQCPFGSTFSNEVQNLFLLGGVVYGGISNVVVPPRLIATFVEGPEDDDPETKDELDFEEDEGFFLYLVVDFDALIQDGVLIPGVEKINTIMYGTGNTIPDNTIPTALSNSGVIHIALGQFGNKSFVPASCGDITITACPGVIGFKRMVSDPLANE